MHPSVRVDVGRGSAVGCPAEQLVKARGHAQALVVSGTAVVETVVGSGHHCSPGKEATVVVVVVVARALKRAGLAHVGQTLAQFPGPATTETVQPSVSVDVGSGGAVGDPPPGHEAGISGQWQNPVEVGETVVETVVGSGHHCSPGRVVSRAARPAAAVVQVAQLLQPGLFQMSTVAVHASVAK